jgi:hypothetical protein
VKRRGGDSGSGEEEPREPGESEREQRERLAKARRERRQQARANLAAKARGEESKGPVAKAKPKASVARAKPSGAKPKTKASGAKPEPKPSGAKPKTKASGDRLAKPAARRRGKAKRGSVPAGVVARATALVGAARSRVAVLAPRLGRLVLRAVLAFFVVFFALIGFALRLAIAAWQFARGPLRAALATLGRWTNAASRFVTPARALTAVTALALVVLALTQFADYRSISIGNDNYAGGIQTVAPAPVTETDATGSAHSYLMIPLALVGLGLLAAAVTGRWRLCRAVALVGLVAVLVGLLHDRPAGLDTGDRPLEYEGVAATLVGGFYAQLAAGLLIMVSSLLLGRELRASASAEPAPRPSRSPSRRRIRLRRRAGVQGARA